MTNVIAGSFGNRLEPERTEALEAEAYRRTVAASVAEMARAGRISGYEVAQWRQWNLSDDDVLALYLGRMLPAELIERIEGLRIGIGETEAADPTGAMPRSDKNNLND